MSLDLAWQEINDLWAETSQQPPLVTSIGQLETLYTLPPQMGNGYERVIKLQPGVELCIFDRIFRDLTLRMPENQHPVQFIVYLSGITDSIGCPRIDSNWGCISGSGIQRPFTSFFPESQRQIGVTIEVQPQVMAQFFGTPEGELPPDMQPFVLGNNQWQRLFSPKTTGAIRTVTQQILSCPFRDATKQLYLQGKVLELMALQLDDAVERGTATQAVTLKPDTIARIRQAAAILQIRLENPPSQTDLAEQVGVSDRTLRRGFQALFGTTFLGYLTEQRLIQAEQLLRDNYLSVAEVSYRCGYSDQSYFATVFKHKFGITPKQCAMGKRVRQN
ncbi:MAG: helix-turn-helix transcriptional regulator [Symploca sp. SIO2G7]|nr:helix-turn-helix transcriptional regulator [Symploca sp. SIO2G7]